MEEEIHTRWILPGAFSIATFLWMAFIFKDPIFIKIISSPPELLVVLIITVPTIGFFASLITHFIANGYTGTFVKSEARRKVQQIFIQDGNRIPDFFDVKKIDPDVLFSLTALGGISHNLQMSEHLIRNGRRRWTIVWASWNSAMGIVFGALLYLILLVFDKNDQNLRYMLGILLPILIGIILFCSGRRARQEVWDLELGWVALNFERIRNSLRQGE